MKKLFLLLSILPATLFGKYDEEKIKIEKQKTPSGPVAKTASGSALPNRENEWEELYAD